MSEPSSDEDDYVYVGTALQHELASTYYATKAPAAADATVALPVHQQQVRDAQGRQRFHGAFTGGYSAGFFNTVGSVEGFQPSTFKSSKVERAQGRAQQISDFLDEDELEEYQKRSLQTTQQFDTFGDQEHQREETCARAEAEQRHNAGASALAHGAAELLRPVPNAVGIELLQKMGWRMGHGIGYREAANLSQMGYTMSPQPRKESVHSRRAWGPLANLSSDNAPVFMLDVKNDAHGLGYDPYRNAREIRDMRKRARSADVEEQRSGQRKRRGLAFEASALEEDDVYGGTLADYADDHDPRAGYNREIVSDEDSDDGLRARLQGPTRIEAHSQAALHIKARQGTMGNDSFIEGFVTANMEVPAASLHAKPELPPGYRAERHKAKQPCAKWYGSVRLGASSLGRSGHATPVKPADPPSDSELKARIDIMAATIARGGSAIQKLAEQTYRDNNDYDFLFGGRGTSYFQYRLDSIAAALRTAGARPPSVPNREPTSSTALLEGTSLSISQRAALLDEAPLPGSTAASQHRARSGERRLGAAAGPAGAPAKQSSVLGSGSDRRGSTASALQAAAPSLLASRFVKAGALVPDKGGWTDAAAEAKAKAEDESQSAAAKKAVRTVHEWRPDPLLCRRFNVPNPFEGRAAKLQPASEQARLLALPESERGDAYAAALPSFMRAPAYPPPQEPLRTESEPAALPPPPPRHQATASDSLPPPPPRPAAQEPAKTQDGASALPPGTDDVDDFLATLEDGVEAAPALNQAGTSQADAGRGDAALLDPNQPTPDIPIEKDFNILSLIFADSDSDEDDASSEGGRGDADAANGEPHAEQPRVAGAGAATEHRQGDAQMQNEAVPEVKPYARGGHVDLASALLNAPRHMAAKAAAARGAPGSTASAEPAAADTAAASAGAGPSRDDGAWPQGSAAESGHSDSEEGDDRRPERARRLRDARSASPETGSESSGARHKRRRKKRKKEKRHKASREELVRDALNTLRQDVTAQGLSTEEILELTKALKRSKDKRHRHKHKKHKKKRRREAEPSSSSGD